MEEFYELYILSCHHGKKYLSHSRQRWLRTAVTLQVSFYTCDHCMTPRKCGVFFNGNKSNESGLSCFPPLKTFVTQYVIMWWCFVKIMWWWCGFFLLSHTFFFFKVDICLHVPIPPFRPGSVHSGSATWDDCWKAFPDELCASSFPRYVSTLHFDSIFSPLWLDWAKGVRTCLTVTCHTHFGHNDWDILVEQTLNKCVHRKLTLEKKILQLLLLGMKAGTLWSWVLHSSNWAIPTTLYHVLVPRGALPYVFYLVFKTRAIECLYQHLL